MLLRTTLIIALGAPLLTNCSAVFKAIDGQTSHGEEKESPIEAPRAASVLGNPVEEGPKDCVPKEGYGQTPPAEETDYPEEDTPPAGDTGQNQSDEPEEDKPSEEDPKEDDEPSKEDPGKDPVEDCK